jgi:hypothetical protein
MSIINQWGSESSLPNQNTRTGKIACCAGCAPTTATSASKQLPRRTTARTTSPALTAALSDPPTTAPQRSPRLRLHKCTACAAGYSTRAHSASCTCPRCAAKTRYPTPISNRNWIGLEISVTHTKHSPALISNRNKNTSISRHSAPTSAVTLAARANHPRSPH